MLKSEALRLLGGSVSAAAKACGITRSAVYQWPDELDHPHLTTVQAALYRKRHKLPAPPARRLGKRAA